MGPNLLTSVANKNIQFTSSYPQALLFSALISYHLTFLSLATTFLNPLIPIIYISCRQVMRMTKNINYGITDGSDTKFSKLT